MKKVAMFAAILALAMAASAQDLPASPDLPTRDCPDHSATIRLADLPLTIEVPQNNYCVTTISDAEFSQRGNFTYSAWNNQDPPRYSVIDRIVITNNSVGDATTCFASGANFLDRCPALTTFDFNESFTIRPYNANNNQLQSKIVPARTSAGRRIYIKVTTYAVQPGTQSANDISFESVAKPD